MVNVLRVAIVGLLACAAPCGAAPVQWIGGTTDLSASTARSCTLQVATNLSVCNGQELSVVWVASNGHTAVALQGVYDSAWAALPSEAGDVSLDRTESIDLSAAPIPDTLYVVYEIIGAARIDFVATATCAQGSAYRVIGEATVNQGTVLPYPPLLSAVDTTGLAAGDSLTLRGLFLAGTPTAFGHRGSVYNNVPLEILSTTDTSTSLLVDKDHLDLTAMAATRAGLPTATIEADLMEEPDIPVQYLFSFTRGVMDEPVSEEELTDLDEITSLDGSVKTALQGMGVTHLRCVYLWSDSALADTIAAQRGANNGNAGLDVFITNELPPAPAGAMSHIPTPEPVPEDRVRLLGTTSRGVRVASLPDDDRWFEQWALNPGINRIMCGQIFESDYITMNMPPAWDHDHDPGIRIAVLDLGPTTAYMSALLHYDIVSMLDDSLSRNTVDTGPPNGNFTDPVISHYHGNAVISIAAATTNNNEGIASPSWGAIPVAVRVLGGYSNNEWLDVIEGIGYVNSQELIPLMNMSLAGEASEGDAHTLALHVREAFGRKKGVVAAAGVWNSEDIIEYPGKLDDFVLTVGGVLWNGLRLSDYNLNYGNEFKGSKVAPWIDVVAPGALIAAARQTPDDYYTTSYVGNQQCNIHITETLGFVGTSASAPLATGLAAWLMQQRSELQPEDAFEVIERTAQDLGDPGKDNEFGNGTIRGDLASAFVRYGRVLQHGRIGNTGESPLAVVDSANVVATFTNTGVGLDGTHQCTRYRLVGNVAFDHDYVGAPDVWVRRASTLGMRPAGAFNYAENAFWGGVVSGSVTDSSCAVETYVYRTNSGRFYPVNPATAYVSYTVIGNSATLSVDDPRVEELAVSTVPMPFRSHTRVRLAMPIAGMVNVSVYDVKGRLIDLVASGWKDAGTLEAEWKPEPREVPAGVYFVRATVNGRDTWKRIIRLP